MKPLDRIDRQILDALQNDGRLSNKELAARVGLAPSSCLSRVKRLVDDGVLLGFHARVAPRALGIALQAMVHVEFRAHSREIIERFRDEVLAHREVLAVYYVAGHTDFLVHVGVSDAEHLRVLVMDAFTTGSDVRHVETNLIFEHRSDPVLPDYLGDAG
jgi:DNA-binding Lrp family transcriptional regulator